MGRKTLSAVVLLATCIVGLLAMTLGIVWLLEGKTPTALLGGIASSACTFALVEVARRIVHRLTPGWPRWLVGP